MDLWNEAKRALGMGDRTTPERADGYDRAEDLLADAPLLALTRSAIKRAEEMAEADIAARFGQPGDVLPGNGAPRRNWIRAKIQEAMEHPVVSATYDMTGALGLIVRREMRAPEFIVRLLDAENIHEACERRAAILPRRYAAIGASGVDLLRRVDEESKALSGMEDEHLSARFHGVPASRIDVPPAGGAERIAWVRDMLIGESACVRQGLIAPEAAIAIAARITVPVPRHDPSGTPLILESMAYHRDLLPWRRISDQAVALSGQDDNTIRTRLTRIPGIAGIVIPPDQGERTRWIERVLVADHVRRISGLGVTDDAATAATLSIEVLGISIHEVEHDGIAFEATLFVDGRRICDIASGRDGLLDVGGWAEGCSPADLDALAGYISATGPLREDGRPDSLEDRILDQVSMHVAVGSYRNARKNAVLFIADRRNPEIEILSVAIPSGGSREGAMEHVRTMHPHAVLLDEMEDEDAALLWTAMI